MTSHGATRLLIFGRIESLPQRLQGFGKYPWCHVHPEQRRYLHVDGAVADAEERWAKIG